MNEIGEYLKKLRTQKGLTTTQVQELSRNKVSQSFVIYVERGEKVPSVEKLTVLADVYEADIHTMIDIMTGKKEKSRDLYALSKDEASLLNHVRNMPKKKRNALFSLIEFNK